MPTFGSLFSGIGGLDLGLERAGWECRWQVEIDPWCSQVLKKHWPDVTRFGDVHDVGGTELEPVDLICGGFPCQPVSVAGKRLAQGDDRWLWPEFARIVRLLRPRLVLVENVTGLLAGHGGMGDVLGDLASSGYDAEWDCLPAAAFGAPHLRYRVFLVAYADARELRLQPARLAGSNDQALASDDGLEGTVADAQVFTEWPRLCPCGAGGQRWGRPCDRCGEIDTWLAEPDVGRVAHGVPARVDRLRALGNAVVPQVAEWIGRRLMEVEGGSSA
jgi:DNA (cytosine-5)-methyltransferase 1